MSFPKLEFSHMTTSRTLDLRMYIRPEIPKGLTPMHYRYKGLTDKLSVLTAQQWNLSPLWTDNGLMEHDQLGVIK